MYYTTAQSPTAEQLLTGLIDVAVIQRGSFYIAWTKTKEGIARYDYAAAHADLLDMTKGIKLIEI